MSRINTICSNLFELPREFCEYLTRIGVKQNRVLPHTKLLKSPIYILSFFLFTIPTFYYSSIPLFHFPLLFHHSMFWSFNPQLATRNNLSTFFPDIPIFQHSSGFIFLLQFQVFPSSHIGWDGSLPILLLLL